MIIELSNLDPVALQIGPIAIRWYSIAYIVGILSAMFYIKYENKKHHIMSKEAYDDWLMWAVLSIILGGRLGYVLFYNPSYFLSNPLEIFAIWQGGMSFHGGLVGSIIGMYLFCRKFKVDLLTLADVTATFVPIGIFCGRIANFINMELYGRPTNGDFGVIFPSDPDLLPRYPSQLYEAFLEGLLLFIILFSLNKFTKIREKKGALSGVFLILYAIFRTIVENFREPDEQLGFLFMHVTMGQLLSVPFILFGTYLILRKNKKPIIHH